MPSGETPILVEADVFVLIEAVDQANLFFAGLAARFEDRKPGSGAIAFDIDQAGIATLIDVARRCECLAHAFGDRFTPRKLREIGDLYDSIGRE